MHDDDQAPREDRAGVHALVADATQRAHSTANSSRVVGEMTTVQSHGSSIDGRMRLVVVPGPLTGGHVSRLSVSSNPHDRNTRLTQRNKRLRWAWVITDDADGPPLWCGYADAVRNQRIRVIVACDPRHP